MKIGFVSRPECPRCIDVISSLRDYLISEGNDIILEKSTAAEMKLDGENIEDLDAEIIITVGGDGTALWTLKKVKAAILPINLGSLGFLSEVSPNSALQALSRLMRGEFKIEERARIKTVLNSRRVADSVNEVVIKTIKTSKIRWFGIYLDN
ncbi:MAG: NAD(+)/NADH kinase, partial [Thermoplasmata archaeon]